ncbi:MAG: hypothetical protein D4R73_08295 [Deltaproteobacteria bacterium]|nr:MAG: hypothetical protein D4R73_08295 [Deltaproteobacteria bacterium]
MIRIKFMFLVMILFLVFASGPAWSGCWAVYSEDFRRTYYRASGIRLPQRGGNFATMEQCQAALDAMRSDPVYRYDFRLSETRCECDSDTGSAPSGGSFEQQLAATVVSSFLNALMRGLQADPGPSGEAQREALQRKWDEEEKERRIAEQKRRDEAFATAQAGALSLLGNRPADGAGAQLPLAGQGPADGVYIGNGTIPTLLRKSNATTEEEWKLARKWQVRIDELMRKHSLSPAEAAELRELEKKRNSLWKRAIGVPGLTAEDREALRLRMHCEGSGSVDGTFDRIVQAREDVTRTGTNGRDLLMLDMTQASLSYGIGTAIEQGAEEYVVNNLGERAVSFGDAYAVGGVAMAFAQGNKEAAAPPAINWLLGKIPGAAFSVGTAQGVGEVYTAVFRKSWDRFVTEIEKVVPGTLPPGGVDQSWDDMKRDATTGQRCVFEWIGL